MPSKFVICLATGLFLVACSSIVVADDVTLDVVTQAWKQTQEKVHSATFQWETRKWIAKGSLTELGSPVARPERDLTHTYKRTLIFKNGNVRYEDSGPHWDPRQEKWVDNREMYTWDGNSAVRYLGNRKTPDAMIFDSNVMLGDSVLSPIQMTFRMFEPTWYVFNLQNFEIAPNMDMVDGTRCWNIETARSLMREKISKGRRPLKAVYTVCPDRNYAVVRYMAINEATGVPTLEIGIKQAWNEKASVWVPSEWTITHHGARGPWRTETSAVLHYSLNEAVSDEKFVVDLPVGTLVSDLRAAKNGEPELYILRAGNEKRVITREEKFRPGATRQELLKTESGMAGLRQSKAGGVFSSPVTYAWMFGISMLALAAGLALRNQLRI